MTALQDQIRELSDADFRDLKLWVITEEDARRKAEPAVRRGQQEVISELQADGKLPKPEYTDAGSVEDVDAVPEWENPGVDHAKMYPPARSSATMTACGSPAPTSIIGSQAGWAFTAPCGETSPTATPTPSRRSQAPAK